jgi:predicted cupin superfamily sugar epimerase
VWRERGGFVMHPRAAQLISSMELASHPEGGYFREVFRSAATVEPGDGRGRRTALTSIYFLLPAGAVSRWHRVRSDEAWHYAEGAPVELLQLSSDELRVERTRLGPDGPDQRPVHCVPAGTWQAARSLGDYTLVGCTVGPGFEYDDFELLADLPQLASRLTGVLPDVGEFL